MSATEAYTALASLQFPPDSGMPQATVSETLTGTFTKRVSQKYVLTVAGTTVVDLAAVGSPGAKALFVQYEQETASDAPINLRFNGGTDDVELAPNGFLLYSSPNPATGITALSIICTGAARVRVDVLG